MVLKSYTHSEEHSFSPHTSKSKGDGRSLLKHHTHQKKKKKAGIEAMYGKFQCKTKVSGNKHMKTRGYCRNVFATLPVADTI